jgi:hypothetical protein
MDRKNDRHTHSSPQQRRKADKRKSTPRNRKDQDRDGSSKKVPKDVSKKQTRGTPRSSPRDPQPTKEELMKFIAPMVAAYVDDLLASAGLEDPEAKGAR